MKTTLYFIVITFLLLQCTQTFANKGGDLANTDVANANSASDANGAKEESQAYRFFEISNSVRTFNRLSRFTGGFEFDREFLDIRFGIRWDNGIFANFGRFGTRGNGVGYNFYNYGNWEFDALVHLGFNSVEIELPADENDFRAGIRATYYSKDAVFRMIASPISINSDDSGFYFGSWYVKNWQLKNWHLHGILGASYFSDNILENRFSASFINDMEEIEFFFSGSGMVFELELGATYAISESWVFEASLGQTLVSNAIYDNPSIDKRGQTYASFGVVYVF